MVAKKSISIGGKRQHHRNDEKAAAEIVGNPRRRKRRQLHGVCNVTAAFSSIVSAAYAVSAALRL